MGVLGTVVHVGCGFVGRQTKPPYKPFSLLFINLLVPSGHLLSELPQSNVRPETGGPIPHVAEIMVDFLPIVRVMVIMYAWRRIIGI